ncbi:glycosyltransferase [Stieleria varia]|uniref:MurG-like transferase n=1 Tax=Stieleria varia TaxID=2528005 RepID=A0A5C5ZQR9_9BACT|nr:glycosyltransferase family 1 protein [Stieleria varia]TWT89257.1 MurG-like transferase [Stieleria varia]
MTRILYAWEWGAGVGHIARFAPIAQRLKQDGNQIAVALRSHSHVDSFFPSDQYEIYQAPVTPDRPPRSIRHPRTLASLSWNLGYCSKERVGSLVKRWIELVHGISPDVIISDFGIGAAIAGAAMQIPQMRLGTGYECPPPQSPLAEIRLAGFPSSVCERDVEDQILNWITTALRESGFHGHSISCFADLIGDQALLSTVGELDHYERATPESSYLGIWDHGDGPPAQWPSNELPRVFAYLKPHPNVPQLLREITRHGYQVAVASDVLKMQRLIPSDLSTVRLQSQLVSLEQIADDCQFAITNGNHGTTLRLLSYGLPILACPLFIEQQVTSQRIAHLGLGRQASLNSVGQFSSAIQQMNNHQIKETVRCFSNRNSDSLDALALDRALTQLQGFLNT